MRDRLKRFCALESIQFSGPTSRPAFGRVNASMSILPAQTAGKLTISKTLVGRRVTGGRDNAFKHKRNNLLLTMLLTELINHGRKTAGKIGRLTYEAPAGLAVTSQYTE